jgi:hypothetical protein
MKKGCYGCTNDIPNQQAHQNPGGCLEGLDSIVKRGSVQRTDSPPLEDVDDVNRTVFKDFVRGIQIDIPPAKTTIPCALCVAYNIRDMDTSLFREAEKGTIVCISHLGCSLATLPSIFTLYENKTHHTSSIRGYTCGCKGCVRNALQCYTEYLSGGGSASYDDGYGFIPPKK